MWYTYPMKSNIKIFDMAMTDAIADFANKKLDHLEKFAPGSDAELALELGKNTKHQKKGDVFFAEATLMVSGKKYQAEAHGADLYNAIDTLVKELKRELTSAKGKEKTRTRRIGKKMKETFHTA